MLSCLPSRRVFGSLREAAIKAARSQQPCQPRIWLRWSIQCGLEALKLRSVQYEVHPVKNDFLRLFAGSLENKILHRQTGKVSASRDEVTLVSRWMQDDSGSHF